MLQSSTTKPLLLASPQNLPRIAAIIFLIATIIRIVFIFAVVGFNQGAANPGKLNGDERDYLARAAHISRGEGFTAGGAYDKMWRMPAYPIFLSTLGLTFGSNQLATIRLLQALLGGLSCLLVFLIASNVFSNTDGTLIGLTAAVWFAFYPPHVYMAGQILSENLLLPVLLAATLAFIRLIKVPSTVRAFLCGFLFGLAALVKPEVFAIIALVTASTLFLQSGRWPARLATGAVVALAATIVIAPWIIRNYQLSGHFIVSSIGGQTFWGGNNEGVLALPQYHGYWMQPSEAPEVLQKVLAVPTEIGQDQMWKALGEDFLKSHQSDLPRLAWYKLKRFYSVLVQNRSERLALIASFGWLLPFIAAGTVINAQRFFRERQPGLLLIAIIVYYNLLAVVFWGSNRLRLMIDPFLIIFGIWALHACVRHLLLSKKGGKRGLGSQVTN